MRFLAILFLVSGYSTAQHSLYATGTNAKGFVVGAKLGPSGVFRRLPSGEWHHLGFNHPFTSALHASAKEHHTLFLAAGNGLIQVTNAGEKWKILTGSDVTELRDLDVDNSTGAVYFTHTRGIAVSQDGGATWRDASGDLKHRYAESIRVDKRDSAVLVAATEAGIYHSKDRGMHWKLAGAAGYQVLRVEQSPADACYWLATTEMGGLFVSRDCAVTFESLPGTLGLDRSLYDLAWDSLREHRVAVAGFHFGIAISEDDGKTWNIRNSGLPSDNVSAVVFDPDKAGRMYASVHENSVFVSADSGKSWTADGLPGSSINRLAFVSDEASQ